jgi:two-component system nitrate/nitrite sensor histidine kinase NarX
MNLLSPSAIDIVGEPAATRGGILADITAGVASGDDLHDLLAHFLRPIIDIAGAAAGAVRVKSEGGPGMPLVASLGLPDEVLVAERGIVGDCGVCGAAAGSDQPQWAGDLLRCARRSSGASFGTGYRRVLAVPLRHRSRTLGVYTLFYDTDAEPAAEVQALLKSVGDLLGLALDNARLEAENLQATLARERQRMAAEVHDSLAQSLAFVKMRMPLLEDALLAREEARAMRYCGDVRSAVSQAHASLRGILTHFRSPMDPQGLLHALEAAVHRFRECSGTELDYVNEWPGLKLDPEQEAQVFHVVQEALSNVARHASARHAWLRVAAAPAGHVEIRIDDDGAGLPAAGPAGGSHYGLEIMLERAQRLGGTFEIGPREGGGTRVRLAIPVPPAPPAPPARAGATAGVR